MQGEKAAQGVAQQMEAVNAQVVGEQLQVAHQVVDASVLERVGKPVAGPIRHDQPQVQLLQDVGAAGYFQPRSAHAVKEDHRGAVGVAVLVEAQGAAVAGGELPAAGAVQDRQVQWRFRAGRRRALGGARRQRRQPGQNHRHQLRLATGVGLAEHRLQLRAHRGRRHLGVVGDAVQGVAADQALGHLALRRGQVVKIAQQRLVHQVVQIGVGDEQGGGGALRVFHVHGAARAHQQRDGHPGGRLGERQGMVAALFQTAGQGLVQRLMLAAVVDAQAPLVVAEHLAVAERAGGDAVERDDIELGVHHRDTDGQALQRGHRQVPGFPGALHLLAEPQRLLHMGHQGVEHAPPPVRLLVEPVVLERDGGFAEQGGHFRPALRVLRGLVHQQSQRRQLFGMAGAVVALVFMHSSSPPQVPSMKPLCT